MKKLLGILLFLVYCISVNAQENINENRGTIKVHKKGHLAKIQFDNVNYRLIGIDQYGNILDTAVVEFKMSMSVKGMFYSENIVGPVLSYQMQQLLGKCGQTTKIFFDKIKAKDSNGTLVDMPKFQYTFGYSYENNE